jgi:uncharacterized LabA/DUF88 family protein
MNYTTRLKRHNKAMTLMDTPNLIISARQLGFGRIDFDALHAYFVQRTGLIRGYAYAPENYSGLNRRLKRLGFEVISRSANGAKSQNGGEHNLDVELAVDMVLFSPYIDQVILLSGDGDFTYAVQAVQRRGVWATVVSPEPTEEGNRTSLRLIEAADEFVALGDVLRESQGQARDPLIHKRKVPELIREVSSSGKGANQVGVRRQAA